MSERWKRWLPWSAWPVRTSAKRCWSHQRAQWELGWGQQVLPAGPSALAVHLREVLVGLHLKCTGSTCLIVQRQLRKWDFIIMRLYHSAF